VSNTFLSTRRHALGEERHFALVALAFALPTKLVRNLFAGQEPKLSGVGIHGSHLLKLGVEIYPYND
jgi:hypothetical protein